METLSFTSCAMNKTTTFLDSNGTNPKFTPVNFLQIKRHVKAFPQNSTGAIYGISSPAESWKNKQETALSSSPPPPPPQTTKENWKPINGKAMITKLDTIAEPTIGRLSEDGHVFLENFVVRSYQIGTDSKLSIAALMSYLQETALNHQKSIGLLADGFGSSPKMIDMNLTWVICWSQIEVDYYPSWGDVVQVEAWNWSGKQVVGGNWRIHDLKTGKIVCRATCFYLMMNKKTRKFTKLGEEIQEELKLSFKDSDPILQKDSRRLTKLDIDKADHVRTGLTPGWTDEDVNQHVSHIKLINFVLESVPRSVAETHQLCAIALDYKRECNSDSVLQSFSKVTTNNNSTNQSTENEGIEFEHSLRFDCGLEIVRGRTKWKPKIAGNSI